MPAMPASTPNAYSSPEITRGSTLLSELNIVKETNHLEFFQKYGFNAYMLMTQLSGGILKIKSSETDNKLFYHYEEYGRDMGYITAASNFASSGVNTSATVALATGSYSAAGARSLPAINQIWYNAQTGVESIVTAVSNGTPNAHTMTIIPVVTGTDVAGLAGQELQFRGYKYLGGASGFTTPIIKTVAKYINYCTQHRMDTKVEDLALMEQLDLIYKGQKYYMLKQLDDDTNRFIQEGELALWDSNLATNLTVDSGSLGLKQWIQQYGINIIYPSFNVQSTFADIERKLDQEAGPMEYDWLQDTNQNIDVNQALGNEFPNGAIIYDMKDLKRGFKKYTPMFRQFNLTRYTPISDSRFYGAQAVSLNSNTGFGVPTGKRDLNGDMKKDSMPQLIKRYQEIEGKKVYAWDTGALSANGKTGVMEKTISQIEYPGLTVQGANQFFYIKKG